MLSILQKSEAKTCELLGSHVFSRFEAVFVHCFPRLGSASSQSDPGV
jgi:hypothetical protein